MEAQDKNGDYSPYEPSTYMGCIFHFPVLVAIWFKAKVCSCSVAGIMCLNLAGGRDVHLLCLLCVLYVATSAMAQLLVQNSPTGCVCLTVCDVETIKQTA